PSEAPKPEESASDASDADPPPSPAPNCAAARRAARLDEAQTGVLLRLLDIALAARVGGVARTPLAAAAHGVRLTLTPAPGRFTTVLTAAGRLHIDGYALTVTAATHTAIRRPELVPA
ncbi:DUF2397 family protein, partial [Micromonospora sp. NPDC007271]|uniref:DUF2397 family protein n=1 Tax=Micromonospora sp. NPDC007271 TaxID=3154587 RepID=UPI0033DD4339